MGKIKQKAVHQVRLYPATYKRLKVIAAKQGITLAELIANLAK